MDSSILGTLSLALGLGLLIGLQRERAGSRLGGIRTFPLIALLGAVCGLLAAEWGALIVVAGLLGVIGIALIANLEKREEGEDTAGQTTEAAALLTYALGALLATGSYAPAIVVGGVTAVLLHFKRPLHEFAGDMTERDIRAVMRFVILTLIILPLLPDQAYGPYAVLNPREIWWMVVLIVGIGMSGYLAYKLFRGRAGLVLGGILGGLVSSTATTVAYARRVRDSPQAVAVAAVTIGIAWVVSMARIIVEVAVVTPALFAAIAPPLAILLLVTLAATAVMLLRGRTGDSSMPEQENPAELKGALVFGALYALIIFAIAAAKDYFGGQALYPIAIVSGFVDVDAITLSTAQLAGAQRIDTGTAWRIILAAALSNVAFKAGIAWIIGSTRLFLRLLFVAGPTLAAGVTMLFGWP